jgi:hypothetical protein
MGIGKTLVQETCYLCKQPFEVGDEIVAKCEHTMHKSCWDENDYHCPEYSDRCKHGAHYYNSQNLLDKNNASFYMKWILMGITAAIIAWTLSTLRLYFINNGINSAILLSIYGLKSGSPEAQSLLRDHILTHMPSFGFYIGLFLTFGIASLALHIRNIKQNFKSVLIEWCQKHQYKVAFSQKESRDGKSHNAPMFHSSVLIEGIPCGTGDGYSKKESDQNAAKQALQRIKRDKDLQNGLKSVRKKQTPAQEEDKQQD